MIISLNRASVDHPIHDCLAERWSPDDFDQRPVPYPELRSLFEAARWAPSSYNEQPWSYIVATKDQPEEFEKLLSCLVDGNQRWAKSAPVLALSVVNPKFERNGKENKAAFHDLGLAAANLVFEATSRGMVVHQMIGIHPDRARELYGIPLSLEPWTALAIGYAATNTLQTRKKERKRKPLKHFVFSQNWGKPASFLP